MIRRKGPILAVAVIAAFALGWYRGLFGIDATPPAPAPQPAPDRQATAPAPAPATVASAPSSATVPEPPAEATKGGAPAASDATTPAPGTPQGAAETQSQAATEAAPAPGFDVVRVEPDGSTVVAGRGAANERIVLTDGTRTFGETKTDANGEFVMSLSLPTGSHRLQLEQREDALSSDAAVVNVPARGQADQLLVMMERPGEASEILQRPTEMPAPSATVSAATPSAPEAPEGQAAAVQPDQPAPASAPAREEAVEQAAPADVPVAVEAVEIEGDRLFVAGSAKGKPTVRVYLDDAFVAESRVGDGDRFIASAKIDVPVGDHMIRADALDASGRVIGRVEVPFQRPEGAAIAAVAPAPSAPTPGTPAVRAPSAQPSARTVAAVEAPPTSPARAPALGAASGEVTAPTTATPQASQQGKAEVAAASAPPATAPVVTGEPEAVKQAPLQAAAARVIIRRGDTLWRISRQTYGRGSRYTVIYLANGDQIRDPNRIYPGQVFRMPSAAEAEPSTRG